ncbi:restriction endonuclease subunit S [Pseudomonas sp. ANT_J28]|uniref:restriction endonuclease subunit S n=1 Tax=Pseudomonas sp. ANT_J28 TaxID=2597352 RepID=UPI0011F3E5D9|nr:restriction endonuclease subunit S [Pseudomonas sp. ANT_J28]KAA0976131.1 type I restriction endonuclease subunit S [Pseudomonas sp. ANT_J28]
MSHYKPYPAYKDSGVEWLGKVPEHWDVKSIKYVAPHVGSGKTPSGGSEVYQDSGILFLRSQNVYDDGLRLDDATYISEEIDLTMKGSRVRANDVLLNITGASIGRSCLVPEIFQPANVNQHVCIIRPESRETAKWLSLCLKSESVQSQIDFSQNGAGREGLNFEQIGNICISLPPTTERLRISEHLEHEVARIDGLIAKKTRFIELLCEKRQALITHAVTKGLDPAAKMKDSGVEWLGDVPEHWAVKRLRLIASVQTGIAKGKDNTDKETVQVPYLRVANVQDGYLDLEEVSTIHIPTKDLDRYLLQKGDVLMNEGGDFDKLGRGHVWHGEVEPCIHQNHVFAVRPNQVQPQWLNTFTSSKAAQFYFMGRSKQSTNLASISSTNLMELSVPVPSDAEQHEILGALSDMTTRLDTLITKTELSLTLLKERRSALITAAVTGQIDLREAS